MFQYLAAVAAFFLIFTGAAHAEPLTQDETQQAAQVDTDINAALAGVCNIQAIAFANLNFTTLTNAQAKCDELVLQTGGDAANCKVKRLSANRFQAVFRKAFQQNNQVLNVLLQNVINFILKNNIFVNNQLKTQLAVSNGCG